MGGPAVLVRRSPRALRSNGTQVQSLQEGAVDVPMEVEEEAHSPPAEEAPQDATALEVTRVSEAGWPRRRCALYQALLSERVHCKPGAIRQLVTVHRASRKQK